MSFSRERLYVAALAGFLTGCPAMAVTGTAASNAGEPASPEAEGVTADEGAASGPGPGVQGDTAPSPPEPLAPLLPAVRTTTIGTVLAVAPPVAPGTVAPRPSDPLAIGRERYRAGDDHGVVSALAPWLEGRHGPWGRARTAGHLLLGLAYEHLGDWNKASTQFYLVRRQEDSPLAPYGAWHEAWVDLKRGRHLVAAHECEAYRRKWPHGPQADECLLLEGQAYAAIGYPWKSVEAYRSWLDDNPDSPRREEVRLAIALAVAKASPSRGKALLMDLWLSHTWPSTELAVNAALDELAKQGIDVTRPTDTQSLMRRAETLRRTGRFDAAWELFQQLSDQADDDPTLAQWVDENADRFAWGTRRYDRYAKLMAEQYEAGPDPDLAWKIFSAWRRAGDWDKALEWGEKGLDAHGSSWRWRYAADDVAWVATIAGRYTDAQKRWVELGKKGGAAGRAARFYAAFTAWRAGDLDAAEEGFNKLIDEGRAWTAASYYWRAKVREAKGDHAGAAADRAQVRAIDEYGWYALLLDEPPSSHSSAWLYRDGSWRGDPAPTLPDWRRPPARPRPATGLFPTTLEVIVGQGGTRAGLRAPARTAPNWSELAWARVKASGSSGRSESARALPTEPGPPSPARAASTSDGGADPEVGEVPIALDPLPDGYQACTWYDPKAADKAFYRFAQDHADLWPELPAAWDLAAAGIDDEAARIVNAVYEEWKDVRQHGAESDPRRQRIRELQVSTAEWRQYFLYVHDHYYAARFCTGLDKRASNDADRLAAQRLAWPVALAPQVWKESRRFGVDPYLVLGLMRQESTYRDDVVSAAGAIGLLQVMPRTGAKVAALLGEPHYSPGELSDADTNLRYGIFYFSRLLQRFGGVFPLAVAAYNGGPHNLSRWYGPWQGPNGPRIGLDALVEQIPWPETRNYVKRVTAHYARYVALYGPKGAKVVVPAQPGPDDPQVIDF